MGSVSFHFLIQCILILRLVFICFSKLHFPDPVIFISSSPFFICHYIPLLPSKPKHISALNFHSSSWCSSTHGIVSPIKENNASQNISHWLKVCLLLKWCAQWQKAGQIQATYLKHLFALPESMEFCMHTRRRRELLINSGYSSHEKALKAFTVAANDLP